MLPYRKEYIIMAQNLLEQYRNRLAISDSMYGKAHMNEKLDNSKKLFIAKVLDNTSRFISEAFDSASGTQRAEMGDFKKFCFN